MIIFLSELQKEHLKLSLEHSASVFLDFCKLAIDYLNNGTNTTKYNTAAENLGVSPNDIQNLVYALVFLLLEGSKHNLSESDFKSSLAIASFPLEHQDVMVRLYNNKKAELSECLYLLQQKDLIYQDLTWRMEVEMASRDNHKKLKPIISMDFVLKSPKNYNIDYNQDRINMYNTTDSGNQTVSTIEINKSIQDAKAASQCQNVIKHVLVQCDLPNLVHMTNKLEQALKESKSQHVRKVKSALVQ